LFFELGAFPTFEELPSGERGFDSLCSCPQIPAFMLPVSGSYTGGKLGNWVSMELWNCVAGSSPGELVRQDGE